MALHDITKLAGSPPLLWGNVKDAFDKINQNFVTLAAASGSGELVDFNLLDTNVSPVVAGEYNLGSTSHTWGELHVSEYLDVPGSASNGVWLGDSHIKGYDGIVDLPNNSKVGGELIIDPNRIGFRKISVTGQSDVNSNGLNPTLTLQTADGVHITTDPISDIITFQNTGVISIQGTTGQIGVNNSTGSVTLTNLGVTALSAGSPITGRPAGTGISVSSSTGNINITNTGVIGIQAGIGITVSTDTATGVTTVSNSAPASLAASFANIVVSGQSNIEADITGDSLTVEAGYGITLTTNALTDTLTVEVDTSILFAPGAIAESLIPDADVTYDLGSATNRWKDLYLSGSTIYLGDATVTATSGGGIATPVERPLGSWFVAYPDTGGTAGTFTLDRPRTVGSTVRIFGGWQDPNYGGPGVPGPGGTFDWTEGDGNFTVEGTTLIITGSQQYQIMNCWEVYTISGESVTATTVTGDTVVTPAISTPDGDLTVTGDLIVTGSITVSPTSIFMGDVTLSASGATLLVNGNPIAAATGNITFSGTTIDSDDSSAITFTPLVTFNSDVVVENDLSVNSSISSATDLNLKAVDAVVISQSPLRLCQFTTEQRDLLSAQIGDMIYNTTDNKFQGYQNGVWVNLDGSV